jgi:hypothetical protein
MAAGANHWPKHWPATVPADRYHHNTLISLVADAVLVEPVFKADTRANSDAYIKIPYSTEQGIFVKEQGICTREQGI